MVVNLNIGYCRLLYDPEFDYYEKVTDPAKYVLNTGWEDVTGNKYHEDRYSKVIKRGPIKARGPEPVDNDDDIDYYCYWTSTYDNEEQCHARSLLSQYAGV